MLDRTALCVNVPETLPYELRISTSSGRCKYRGKFFIIFSLNTHIKTASFFITCSVTNFNI